MDFNQIRYFLAVVSCGSFSVAAAEEYISQSGISKQIKALEDELGVQLFTRTLNKIHITPAGEDFLKFAQKTKIDFTNMKNDMAKYTGGPIHTLKIGSIPALSDYGIDTHLARFQANNLSVRIDLEVREQKKISSMIRSNHLDLAFIRINNLDIKELRCLKVVNDEIVLVCSKNHHLASKKEISPNLLSEEKFIMLDERSNVYHICLNEFAEYNFKPNIVISNSRHETILSFVKENLGITLLPKRLISLYDLTDLACINLTSPIDSSVYLICLKKNFNNLLIQQFWSYFESHCNI